MTKIPTHKLLTFCIAAIWLTNGLFCKVLDLVPRHELIVARILETANPRPWSLAIGISEILMAVWILSGYRSQLNVIAQSLIIAIMNTLEFVLVPDLLLWGKRNALFAFLLILVILFNEFYLNKKAGHTP